MTLSTINIEVHVV